MNSNINRHLKKSVSPSFERDRTSITSIDDSSTPVFTDLLPSENTGTPGRDLLTGTAGNDRLVGLQGSDVLIGGSGSDEFIYTSFIDRGDVITDFEIGSDKIVLTELLQSLGYVGGDAIADGYVSFVQQEGSTQIDINLVGIPHTSIAIPLLTVVGVSANELNSASNFTF